METRPINAICLGGPCHGTLTHIRQDIGSIDVPLPPPDDGTADYHITRERVHHPSCRVPLIVLHWNHPIPSFGCATPASCTCRT
ncbi:MAG: hypothetical protein ACRDOO_23145 [Actinomadura sp.]